MAFIVLGMGMNWYSLGSFSTYALMHCNIDISPYPSLLLVSESDMTEPLVAEKGLQMTRNKQYRLMIL